MCFIFYLTQCTKKNNEDVVFDVAPTVRCREKSGVRFIRPVLEVPLEDGFTMFWHEGYVWDYSVIPCDAASVSFVRKARFTAMISVLLRTFLPTRGKPRCPFGAACSRTYSRHRATQSPHHIGRFYRSLFSVVLLYTAVVVHFASRASVYGRRSERPLRPLVARTPRERCVRVLLPHSLDRLGPTHDGVSSNL